MLRKCKINVWQNVDSTLALCYRFFLSNNFRHFALIVWHLFAFRKTSQLLQFLPTPGNIFILYKSDDSPVQSHHPSSFSYRRTRRIQNTPPKLWSCFPVSLLSACWPSSLAPRQAGLSERGSGPESVLLTSGSAGKYCMIFPQYNYRYFLLIFRDLFHGHI